MASRRRTLPTLKRFRAMNPRRVSPTNGACAEHSVAIVERREVIKAVAERISCIVFPSTQT